MTWWGLHTEGLTVVGDGGPDREVFGYNVQQVSAGGATAVGVESVAATRVRVSGPSTDAVIDGATVVHRGTVYEVNGPPAVFGSGVLDHVEFELIERFPPKWLTSVVVVRSGGRDARGNPRPAQRIPVDRCLVRWTGSGDLVDRTDVSTGTAVLYRRRSSSFAFVPTDRIEIPDSALVPGVWAVDGAPKLWPNSVELTLKKEAGST
ncbi:hypothetical protein [Tersicoccus sp. Bi-70]|uniref:hypothetical protein n=1 Tax=Tersicoccus sp. Bi-70 TaxID=1897634 RepID=UPI0009762A9C|nr:hypothetical protein [Tersicoccus sp. Bi-70]OMH30650.1 hypothetical protein BGP79_11875 [Tersicoccus sp. Bi-70]